MTKRRRKKKAKTVRYRVLTRQDIRHGAPKSYQKIAVILAASAVLLVLMFYWRVRGSYLGLDDPENIPRNPYDLSSFRLQNGVMTYEDEAYESVYGIDVSEHQGAIDWEKVAKDGVQFAFVRVAYRGQTNGQLYEDARYEENIEGALSAGIPVGVYVYSQAATTDEAVEEAKFLIRRVRRYNISYPVVFDMEDSKRISDLTPRERTEITTAFCQVVAQNGFTPMIYGNYSWLTNRIQRKYLTDYDFWLAHYTTQTMYPYSFVFWQYSDRGMVDGIARTVDLDVRLVAK